MNQILETKKKKYKLKKFFKIQFFISFILIIIVFIYALIENNIKNRENEFTKIANQNAKLSSMFRKNDLKNNNLNEEIDNIYFCTLKIEKINLEYFVYENYSEENLKILPCKFSGGNLRENTNICIIGHNYFDDRFFGRLDELEIGDKIIVGDLKENSYLYKVFDIYEIDENNIYEATKNEFNEKILSLCTCTFSQDKRLIIKAKRV